ncbi:hypothetical protein BT69DRAFT_1278071, partial [Atractiella rhizophila]
MTEGLFQKHSITGSGTQVWTCEFEDGTGYGVIKHVWLDETILGRMKKVVEHRPRKHCGVDSRNADRRI